MDNRAVLKCQEYERQLKHNLERQKMVNQKGE